jgi:DNA-binding SARP family transcriptional activator
MTTSCLRGDPAPPWAIAVHRSGSYVGPTAPPALLRRLSRVTPVVAHLPREAMIRFHTLGVLDLRGPDGAELGAVLRQPKRLGRLAYLALASPRRFYRRDSLLALFWPTLDEEHARAALRRALYFLRMDLGSEVVTGRGDEEVGVSGELLWCDAPALDRALASGDFEDALALYRGALLEGLHVAGAAPEFQEWLDQERGRLRERAGGAARSLAARAEADGRLADAARFSDVALYSGI